MSPLEHYHEAEKILALVAKPDLIADAPTDEVAHMLVADLIAKAQVHATLATVEAHTSAAWGGRERE